MPLRPSSARPVVRHDSCATPNHQSSCNHTNMHRRWVVQLCAQECARATTVVNKGVGQQCVCREYVHERRRCTALGCKHGELPAERKWGGGLGSEMFPTYRT